MSWEYVLSEAAVQLSFLVLAVLKFLYTPGVMLASGYSALHTIIVCSLGGTSGAALFFMAGRLIFNRFERLFPPKKDKKVFTRTKRRIILFKKRFGIIGLAVIVPLISVPVSAVIAAKYYKNRLRVVAAYFLILSVWSVILTLFSSRIIEMIKLLF